MEQQPEQEVSDTVVLNSFCSTGGGLPYLGSSARGQVATPAPAVQNIGSVTGTTVDGNIGKSVSLNHLILVLCQ